MPAVMLRTISQVPLRCVILRILLAFSVIGFPRSVRADGTYRVLGNNIGTLASRVDSALKRLLTFGRLGWAVLTFWGKHLGS